MGEWVNELGNNEQGAELQKAEAKQAPTNISGQTQIQVTQTKFEGPLPAPQILQGYDEVYPGAAEIIIEDFRQNSEYIRETNRKALDAQIAKEKRGQYMAFLILFGILVTVFVSLALGNITFAGVSGIAFLAFSSKSFLGNKEK